MKYKIRVIVVLLVVLLASLARSSPAFASIPIGTGDDNCHTPADCERLYPGSGAQCNGSICVVVTSNSLRDFQETNKTARTSGQWPFERWSADPESPSSLTNITNGLASSLIGSDLEWDKLAAGDFRHVQIGGLLGTSSNLLASIITQPPVSSYEYFADLGRNLGLPVAKTAYAQGIGFTGLSNLLPLWKAARNLSYFLFVIIFIAMGLAIMFRVKLDPKTVISIQNALPKLVIALILVTFSYAIAGLMIDLIYVLIYLAILALKGVPGMPANIAAEQAKYVSLGFGNAVGLVFGGLATGLIHVAGGLLAGSVALAIIGLITSFTPLAIAGGGAIGLIILIFGIITLFLIIKLFFSLISCYIAIIISVITAPLQIMMGVLPGSSGGFGAWFSNLMANILVFPAVALVLLLGWLLTQATGPSWTPPVLSTSGGALSAILGMGMLLLVNKVPDMIKEMFKMKPGKLGAAIGETLGAPGRAFMGIANFASAGTKIGTSWKTKFGTSEPPSAPERGRTNTIRTKTDEAPDEPSPPSEGG